MVMPETPNSRTRSPTRAPPVRRTVHIGLQSLGAGGPAPFAPHLTPPASGQLDRLVGQQREELLDPDPEQIREGTGVATQAYLVGLVDDPAVRTDQHGTPTV